MSLNTLKDRQAAVMEGAFANGSAFGGTPAHEIYRCNT